MPSKNNNQDTDDEKEDLSIDLLRFPRLRTMSELMAQMQDVRLAIGKGLIEGRAPISDTSANLLLRADKNLLKGAELELRHGIHMKNTGAEFFLDRPLTSPHRVIDGDQSQFPKSLPDRAKQTPRKAGAKRTPHKKRAKKQNVLRDVIRKASARKQSR